MTPRLLLLTLLPLLHAVFPCDIRAEPVLLSLSEAGPHEVTLVSVGEGVYEITTTGADPFLFTDVVPAGINVSENPILAFEYFSLTGTGEIQVFAVPPTQEAISVHGPGLGRSEGWSSHRIDLSPLVGRVTGPVKQLRIDFGRNAGKTAQLRNIVLRELNEDERTLAARAAEDKAQEAAKDDLLRAYLGGDKHSEITLVKVDSTTVVIEGVADWGVDERAGGGVMWLVEMPVYGDMGDPSSFLEIKAVSPEEGRFTHTLPRYAEDGRDRLYSRWAVLLKTDSGISYSARGHYADTVKTRPGLAEATLRGSKGLGGFSPGRPVEDIEDLGIAAVTVNIDLNSFMAAEAGDGRMPYEYGGRTWYTVDGGVAHLDDTMKTAAEHDLVVSAIILISPATGAPEGSFRRLVAHPDADPAGIYVMPNFTSAEGVNAYGAALNFLAERYSRPDGEFGRIHHWIVHNEVNSGWVWTNMGDKSALRYMDAYHKSMRMAQLIAWQYDPFSKVYISLEHHWNSVYADHCYKGKELLEMLLQFSRAEGDFPWAIAYHPYPENLRDPRVWEDDTAWFSFDTPRITFKNMEVIDAWVKKPENRYQETSVRDVQLTEQGPNSPDYLEESLRDQAACMAYLWKKMAALDSVSMFHFHNWVDNRHEGGLRIGLRRFPDDEEDPHGKKPVWYVFQALDTENEAESTEFAKEVIGIKDWSEVIYTGEITETKGE